MSTDKPPLIHLTGYWADYVAFPDGAWHATVRCDDATSYMVSGDSADILPRRAPIPDGTLTEIFGYDKHEGLAGLSDWIDARLVTPTDPPATPAQPTTSSLAALVNPDTPTVGTSLAVSVRPVEASSSCASLAETFGDLVA